jgi:hypothetical protein
MRASIELHTSSLKLTTLPGDGVCVCVRMLKYVVQQLQFELAFSRTAWSTSDCVRLAEG